MSNLNIVIPCAGRGQRFKDAGYTFPKLLLELPLPHNPGKTGPMIEMVVANLNLVGNYIFLVLKEDYEKYSLKYLLPLISKPNNCEIIIVDKVTRGAAETVLLAKNYINNDNNLLLANSDQYVDFDSTHMLKFIKNNKGDGCVQSFVNSHPKYSFCKLNDDGEVILVIEKSPISSVASTGIYFWNHGEDFVNSAEEMIAANDMTNNEFYIAPTYNYLIKYGKKILNYPVAEMISCGTPEDLQRFTRIMEERNK